MTHSVFPSPLVDPGAPAADAARGGLLATTLQELLTVSARLRTSPQSVPSNGEAFRASVLQLVANATREGRRLAYREDSLGFVMYAAVAYLDETVLALATPAFAAWKGRPLQEELFQVHIGGDVFFSYLDTLLRQESSQELADVLEVYMLCLLLGFRGRYDSSRREELHQWTARVRDRIGEIRGTPPILAPRWEPPRTEVVERRVDAWQRRLQLASLGVLLATVVFYAGFAWSLRSQVAGLLVGR